MQPPPQHSRINLAELKAQIIEKLGLEGSKQYFYHLNRFLSLKLSKVEFNKLCLRIVGRENIPLHNHFVRSILKNACNAKVPPPIQDKDAVKSTGATANKMAPPDGYVQNGPYPSLTQATSPLVLSSGDILLSSPQKKISVIHDHRAGDRLSPLGQNGKMDFSSQQSINTHDSDFNVVSENVNLTSYDIQRPLQHHQRIMECAENEREVKCHLPSKLSTINRLPDVSVPVHRKDEIEVVVKDGKEVTARSLLRAPLGIPFCPVSLGAARRTMPLASVSKCASSFVSGGLSDARMLRERMELIAATQGLEGISMDCATLLNNGLEIYLRDLIRSCIELVKARSGDELPKNSFHKNHSHEKLVYGPGHYQLQSSSRPLEDMQDQRPQCAISLLDFKVAMELKPQQLGEDWPLLLEKIYNYSFED